MITGRWDATVSEGQREYAAWFEIFKGGSGYSGRYVGIEGSQRPMREVKYGNKELYFRLPPQYEKHPGDLIFEGIFDGEKITGKTNDPKGNWVSFTASPAPKLEPRELNLGKPISIIEASMNNWENRQSDSKSGWEILDGVLSNTPPSVDILTRQTFSDFRLQGEFRVPRNGNSGIYLRGRYEVQILGDYGKKPSTTSTGSIYGYLEPLINATKPIGEWNKFDITLNGRWVSITLNGVLIIDNKEIPGLTGGAYDADESLPGPIMLQGDHRAVEYRNLLITPAK